MTCPCIPCCRGCRPGAVRCGSSRAGRRVTARACVAACVCTCTCSLAGYNVVVPCYLAQRAAAVCLVTLIRKPFLSTFDPLERCTTRIERSLFPLRARCVASTMLHMHARAHMHVHAHARNIIIIATSTSSTCTDCNVNAYGAQPSGTVCGSVSPADVALVRRLCERGVAADDNYALRLAAQHGHAAVVRCLAYTLVEKRSCTEPYPVPGHIVSGFVADSLTAGRRHACRLARFLCLELPGGTRWLHVAEELLGRSGADRSQVPRWLLGAARRHRVWRRRGCLLLLRCLRSTGRSLPVARPRSHGVCSGWC
jgi:hypothetical protein